MSVLSSGSLGASYGAARRLGVSLWKTWVISGELTFLVCWRLKPWRDASGPLCPAAQPSCGHLRPPPAPVLRPALRLFGTMCLGRLREGAYRLERLGMSTPRGSPGLSGGAGLAVGTIQNRGSWRRLWKHAVPGCLCSPVCLLGVPRLMPVPGLNLESSPVSTLSFDFFSFPVVEDAFWKEPRHSPLLWWRRFSAPGCLPRGPFKESRVPLHHHRWVLALSLNFCRWKQAVCPTPCPSSSKQDDCSEAYPCHAGSGGPFLLIPVYYAIL